MRLLAHRGLWCETVPKNSRRAIELAFAAGYGVETDVRDANGRIVISHDPPTSRALLLSELLELHDAYGKHLPLALNVKSDGLVTLLDPRVLAGRDHYFFDMSVPDMLGYLSAGLPVYTRQSEIERAPALIDRSIGVWLDAFFSNWPTTQDIGQLLATGMSVCLVSPELHGREHLEWWRTAVLPLAGEERLMLCTDYPQQAEEVFAA